MDNNQILAQLLAAPQGGPVGGPQNPLDWLKGFADPRSASGALANQDAYNAYAEQEMTEGRQPMSRPDFLRLMSEAQNGI